MIEFITNGQKNFEIRVFYINFAVEKMNTDHLIIVIGRQFGAGGRAIGHALASRLGMAYYDKNLLEKAAEEFGLSSEIFARADEKRPSVIKQFLSLSYGVTDAYSRDTLSGENLFNAQSEVIRLLASKGPAVFVGRTADYILRDEPGLVSVFLHADDECRTKRIVERGDAPDADKAIELARRRDKDREGYYNYFTGRRWGKAETYHITFDASFLSPEQGADIIEAFARASGKIK